MTSDSTITQSADGLAVRVVLSSASAGTGTHRLIAYNNTASVTIPTTPTPVAWTGQSVPDSTFSLANGVITFSSDSEFQSVFTANLSSSGGTGSVMSYYTDAEVSTDGGTSWTRGTLSLRQESVRGSDNHATRSWAFSGGFTAGMKLRFVHWAENANGRATTDTVGASICPAFRLTYTLTPATFAA